MNGLKFFFTLALCSAVFLFLPSNSFGEEHLKNIRVLVAEGQNCVDFKPVGGIYELVDQSSGKVIDKIKAGSEWRAGIKGSKIEVLEAKNSRGNYAGPLLVRPASAELAVVTGFSSLPQKVAISNIFLLDGSDQLAACGNYANLVALSTAGKKPLNLAADGALLALGAGSETAVYRGELEIHAKSGAISVVNRVPLEDYLRGVVPSEMPASWPLEALKAQAVAARNYALLQVKNSKDIYDVRADQLSQVYRGCGVETPAADRAVLETAGVVLLYNGELAYTFYHSSSGGFTENSEDVWLNPLPYIKGKADPYDKNDLHYNWQVSYTADQLAIQLKKAGYNFKKITGLEELSRTSSGQRVKKILVKGEDEKGSPIKVEIGNADAVRTALGLKSALFTMNVKKDAKGLLSSVEIRGSGFGHGLGMSQWGARGMAQKGYNYQDILRYYFTGVKLAAGYGKQPLPDGPQNLAKEGSQESLPWLGKQ